MTFQNRDVSVQVSSTSAVAALQSVSMASAPVLVPLGKEGEA